MNVVLIGAGLAMIAGGATMFARSTGRLRRAGVLRGIFWASLREYWSYRRRALRPLPVALGGLLLIGAGLVTGYVGLAAFYGSRMGHILRH